MPKKNKFIAGGLALAGLAGLWSVGSWLSGESEVASADHLVNQVWIERMPEDQRDMVAHLVVIDHPQGQIGVAGRSSQWRHLIEAFLWRLDGDQLRLRFPQDRVRAKVQARTWRCAGEAPRPFELCLEIRAGDRQATFYSREDWVVRPHESDAFEAVAEELPQLAAALDQADELVEVEVDAQQWPEADLFERL